MRRKSLEGTSMEDASTPQPDAQEHEEFSKEEKELVNELLTSTFNSITRIEERSLKNRLTRDLSIAEIHTIEAIGMYDQKPMKDVANQLGVTLATVNAAVNKLERKGYVERKRGEQDRRQMLASLTSSGRKALRVHDMFHKRMIDSALSGLTHEESRAFARAVAGIKQFFDQEYEAVQAQEAKVD